MSRRPNQVKLDWGLLGGLRYARKSFFISKFRFSNLYSRFHFHYRFYFCLWFFFVYTKTLYKNRITNHSEVVDMVKDLKGNYVEADWMTSKKETRDTGVRKQ